MSHVKNNYIKIINAGNPKYKITVYGGNSDEINIESFLDEVIDANKIVKKYISKIRIISNNI